ESVSALSVGLLSTTVESAVRTCRDSGRRAITSGSGAVSRRHVEQPVTLETVVRSRMSATIRWAGRMAPPWQWSPAGSTQEAHQSAEGPAGAYGLGQAYGGVPDCAMDLESSTVAECGDPEFLPSTGADLATAMASQIVRKERST